MAWYSLAMSAIAVPVLPSLLYLTLAFVPPVALITCAIVVVVRDSRWAAISCIGIAALLVCWLVSVTFSLVAELFRAPQPLQPPTDSVDYIIASIIAFFTVCVVASMIALVRSITSASNKTMQRTAGRAAT